MNARDLVIHPLQTHRNELAASYGVRTLALFGSVARNEAPDHSDFVLLVEFDRATGYLGLVALQAHLAHLLHRPFDLGTLRCLNARVSQRVEQDLSYVS